MAAPLEHTRDGGYGASAKQAAIQAAAAAAAAEAYSPEAIAAEAKRQEDRIAAEAAQWRKEGREQCIREHRPIEAQYLEPSPPLPGGVDGNGEHMISEGGPVYTDPTGLDEDGTVPSPRKSRLAEILAEVVEPEEAEEEPVPAEVMGGAHLVRWILLPAEEGDGWTLGLSTESHEDESPDAVYLEITQAMMRKWRNAPASANDLERFAAGLMEKVADALAEDLTDRLIESLQRITTGELRERQYLLPPSGIELTGYPQDLPTETSVGEDEPVPFSNLDEYVQARDAYAQMMSAGEFSAFLDENQDYEDEIERRASEPTQFEIDSYGGDDA